MTTFVRTRATSFAHLMRMTDDRGLYEHALFDQPAVEHGYCVDDVARGLIVAVREVHPTPEVESLATLYLDFLLKSMTPDGQVRNRMNTDGVWTTEPCLDDCWGRAVWGLGTASAKAQMPAMRKRALLGFERAATRRSPNFMSMTFAALGAAEALQANPKLDSARMMLIDYVEIVGAVDVSDGWPWPETRLRYSNGHVTQALIMAGRVLPHDETLVGSLRLLDWLLDMEMHDGHLSTTPAGGRGRGDRQPAFDQQPIEVAAIADACAEAYVATGDEHWLDGIELAWHWFLGNNDSRVPMVDTRIGSGFDGLEMYGRNANQGAESTLAAMSTAQHAYRYGLRE